MTDEAGNWITYNGEIYNYLELRDELGGERFRTDSRHRGRPARPTTAGATDCARPPARHVRLRALGRARARRSSARATASASSRFYYAVVDDVLYFASEAKALLPFLPRDRDRPRGPQGLPRLPVLPRRQDAVRGRPRAAARPLAARAQRQRRDASATGRSTTSSTSSTRRRTSRSSIEELLHESVAAAPAHRRAGRRVPQRRPRLEHRRLAGRATHAAASSMRLHRQVRRGPALRREPLRARRSPTQRGFDAARGRHRRRRLRRAHRATSSTTSTTRSPGPGSFPQYMVSQAGRARTAR